MAQQTRVNSLQSSRGAPIRWSNWVSMVEDIWSSTTSTVQRSRYYPWLEADCGPGEKTIFISVRESQRGEISVQRFMRCVNSLHKHIIASYYCEQQREMQRLYFYSKQQGLYYRGFWAGIDFSVIVCNYLGNRWKTHLWIIFHSELMENLMFLFYFPAWGCHDFHWNTLSQTTSETLAKNQRSSPRIPAIIIFLVSLEDYARQSIERVWERDQRDWWEKI